MPQELRTICCNCKRIKEQANHWFRVRKGEDGAIIVQKFDGSAHPGDEFLCGEKCLQYTVRSWIDRGEIVAEFVPQAHQAAA